MKNFAIAILLCLFCFGDSTAEQQGLAVVTSAGPEATYRIDRQDYIVGCYIEGYISGVYSSPEAWTMKEPHEMARDAIAVFEAYEEERQQPRNQK